MALAGFAATIACATNVPGITSFTPASGPAGTVVTITGTNFTGATAVSFNNITAAAFTVSSPTQITATVPTGNATGFIRVTTPSATAASATAFTVPAPTITSFTPTSGPAGTVVVITGANFAGITAVSFNGVNAPGFVVNSSTQITVSVPANATTGPIRVTGNVVATSGTAFTVPPPAVTSFTPTSGPAGTSVVITGANFTGATAVTIGGTPAPSFAVNSPTQITVVVPANAFTGPVCVTTPAGTGCSAGTFNTGNLAFLIGTNQTTCSGTLYDSGGPNAPYQDNENLTSVLTPANGSKMVLTFTAFDTENTFDVLRIYDGPTAASPPLGAFSGTAIPGPIQASASNASGQLTLVFTSDGSITRPGFAIALSCLAPPTCTLVTNLTVTNITSMSATLNFTPGIGNNSYIVTYTRPGGPSQTVTGTASPINLTGLVPSTVYSVSVQPVCTVGTSTGTVTLASFTTQLPNDDPCGAITLGATPTAASNVNASSSVQNGIVLPACSGGPLPRDVWFAFTPTSTSLTLTLTGTAAGSFRVFTSPSCSAGPFTEITCRGSGANNVGFSTPQLITGLTVGTRYYLAVNGFGASDLTGSFTVAATNILATRARTESDALVVFPNPSNTGQLTLRLSGLTGGGKATLLNALGQTVLAQPLTGASEQTLSTRTLAAGLYTLRVTVAGQTLTRKVVLE